MSWRVDSTAGATIWDSQEPTAEEILCRNEELVWLAKQDQRRGWSLINGRIADSKHPTNTLGVYGGLQAYPPNAVQTTAATTTATPGTCWWTDTIYSPLLANAVMAPSFYEVRASGTIATTTTSQTTTILPSIGTGTVNAAPTTHQDLGVSGVATLATTALTAGWMLQGQLTIRSTGTAGTAWFTGIWNFTSSALPATNAASPQIFFGGTVATIDFTGATANYPGGFQMSSWQAATVNVITNSVAFIAFN